MPQAVINRFRHRIVRESNLINSQPTSAAIKEFNVGPMPEVLVQVAGLTMPGKAIRRIDRKLVTTEKQLVKFIIGSREGCMQEFCAL